MPLLEKCSACRQVWSETSLTTVKVGDNTFHLCLACAAMKIEQLLEPIANEEKEDFLRRDY